MGKPAVQRYLRAAKTQKASVAPTALRGDKADLDCRRRRRGPKVRQDRGRAA